MYKEVNVTQPWTDVLQMYQEVNGLDLGLTFYRCTKKEMCWDIGLTFTDVPRNKCVGTLD